MVESGKGTAVITGASSGIGAVYADRLARRGYDLLIVARNGERLNALAKRITDETGRTVEVMVADLTDAAELRAVETALKSDASVTMLVNNAGIGAGSPLLETSVDRMEQLIAINVTAPTRLTYAVAPGFVARGAGTIINIASIVAIAPEMLNGVYGASKSFILAFSQSLVHELKDKGIVVQAVLPGATATEFWDVMGSSVDAMPADWVMSAEDMVDAALAGLDLGEFATIPALPNAADLATYEAARQVLVPQLTSRVPAQRYLEPVAA